MIFAISLVKLIPCKPDDFIEDRLFINRGEIQSRQRRIRELKDNLYEMANLKKTYEKELSELMSIKGY